MASRLQLPAWAVHVAGMLIAALTFLATSQEFMGAISGHPRWTMFFHLAPGFITYAGISQIASTPKGNP